MAKWTAAQYLAQALDRVQKGWVKGNLIARNDKGDPNYCILGALGVTAGTRMAWNQYPEGLRATAQEIALVVKEQYPDEDFRWLNGASIHRFNDAWGTTKEEVERVMEKALIRLTERVDD